MTHQQWQDLLKIIRGVKPEKTTAGFIIDSPWIPGWAGITTLQYYVSDKLWFQSNKKVLEVFPEVMFFPGFWSEYGMCTEPSAFGSKLIWNESSLPWAGKVINKTEDIATLKIPNPKTDGLLPFVIQRLLNNQDVIHQLGHEIKFAVSRGPLNIASYLRGTTELMTDIMMAPEEVRHLLEKITTFTIDWLQYQKSIFPSIEGIFILDDLIGFVGKQEFQHFALPYLKRIFHAFNADVRFLHNDAQGLITSRFLSEMGVNLFNFSYEHSIEEIRNLSGPDVILLGNLPPRDILAAGTPEIVRKETKKMISQVPHLSGIIWSCGGGMPPDVPTENILAFLETVSSFEP